MDKEAKIVRGDWTFYGSSTMNWILFPRAVLWVRDADPWDVERLIRVPDWILERKPLTNELQWVQVTG